MDFQELTVENNFGNYVLSENTIGLIEDNIDPFNNKEISNKLVNDYLKLIDDICIWVNENYSKYINKTKLRINYHQNMTELLENSMDSLIEDDREFMTEFRSYYYIILQDSVDWEKLINDVELEFEERKCVLKNNDFDFKKLFV